MNITKLQELVSQGIQIEHKLRFENERLKKALRQLVNDILEYERINNLSPNPGRQYCWDSVAEAIALLEQKP